jgi:two-component system sensor histidine kinase AlgZ
MVNLVARRKVAPPVEAENKTEPLKESGTASFWPDFTSYSLTVRMLMMVVLASFVIALSRASAVGSEIVEDFIITVSLGVLITFFGLAVLRLGSSHLQEMSSLRATLAVTIILVVVTIAALEGVAWALYAFRAGPYPLAEQHGWNLFRIAAIASLVGAFLVRYVVVDYRAEMEIQAKQADRLQALQSRIRPHFMFNSLNSVASLIRHEPEMAEQALEDLADLFRVLLADARKMVPITVEGELARQYLEIEKIRLGERLSVRWTASNVPRSALLPSLTLQPLVENAVYHGIEPSSAGGTVIVRQWSEGETLNILISNPLPEIQNKAHRKGNNIALDNVRERLERHFGGRALLRNGERDGTYEVQVRIPIMRG